MQVIFYKIDKDNLRDFIEYSLNVEFLNRTKYLINLLNSTNREVLTTKGKTLFLKLPDPTTISNGERDLLCLLASVYSILNSRHRKQQAIIVFDEIFDYLDGGNILEFQYLIDYLIQESKNNNAKTYFIAFTHLDPLYFNTFVLNNIAIEYFDDYSDLEDNLVLINYIKNRDISTIKDDVDSYFFHFNPEDFVFKSGICLSNDFEISFVNDFPSKDIFYKHLDECVEKYLNNQKYSFVDLCIWIRIQCEKYAYYNLEESLRNDFLSIHTVRKKLEFANKTISIPEIFNLFKFLYNEGEHFEEKTLLCKKKTLHLKFSSKSVKHLVGFLKDMMIDIENK